MADHNHDELRRLFDLVSDAPAEERLAILDRECGGDADLRSRLLAMVAAAEEERFLGAETPGIGITPPLPSDAGARTVESEQIGEEIGHYKLLQQIGEGGFGVVYMAEQKKPVRRLVALKIIKLGMDTKQVIARFEAERQALAMMDHPNIAKVLDAGSTDRGRPYFVMELVKGTSFTEYCDSQNVAFIDRLKLFMQVCGAVQHAHQKGVIHRDLKPSNILVTHVDERPVPNVIDFGIAKATQQRLTEMTMFTEFGQFLGTPAYMAPEQTDPNLLDIDTRSDIYSLGVMLYELLTGTTPFDSRTLRGAALDEVKRIIREEEPSRPSTKLSTLGEELTTVAKHRGLEPKRLRTILRGDLDWIVLKALEKDRARRYDTASSLARDIERYLNDEPVVAGPPSASYKLQKFVKRNKAGVAAAALVVAVLVLGVLGTSWGMLRAFDQKERADLEASNARLAATAEEQAKNEAQEAARLAREAAAEATAARAEAHQRAAELEIVTEFQQSMLGELSAEQMGWALYADLRNRVRESLESEGVGSEDREAAVADFFRTLRRANATDVALKLIDEEVLQRAVQAINTDFADQPLVRAALRQTVADTYRQIGRYPPALPLQEAALETRRRELGDDHPDTLQSINDLAYLLELMGDWEQAETHYEEALAGRRRVYGDEHRLTYVAMNNLGLLIQQRGRVEEAYELHTAVLDGRRQLLGEDDPDTLSSLMNVGSIHDDMGQPEEALSYFSAALDGCRRVLGDDHLETIVAINNMGNIMRELGRFDEALAYHSESLAARRRVQGDEHPDTLIAITNMGILLIARQQWEEALPHFQEALEGFRQALGDDHPNTLIAVSCIGVVLRGMDRLEEAEPYYREALAGNRRTLGDDHPNTATAKHNMGRLLRELGRLDEAAALGAEVVTWARATMPAEHPGIAAYLLGYAQTLRALERYGEAETLLLEAYELLAAGYGRSHRRTLSVAQALVDLYEAWHVFQPGAGYDAKAAPWRQAAEESIDDDGQGESG
jgi:eukaryotic-like serine/threonine-protein kinase